LIRSQRVQIVAGNAAGTTQLQREDALWRSWQSGTGCRLLFIARPSDAVRGAIEQSLASHRDAGLLGRNAFPAENWHQSLSERYIDTPELREILLRAGAMLRTPTFTLQLDAIRCSGNDRGSIQWEVRSRGRSRELTALIAEINAVLVSCGLPPGGCHSPHITVHYAAKAMLPREQAITPVNWIIDAVELVMGGGSPYRYTTLGRWKLAPELPRPLQVDLFRVSSAV